MGRQPGRKSAVSNDGTPQIVCQESQMALRGPFARLALSTDRVAALAAWRPGLESQTRGILKKVSRFRLLRHGLENRIHLRGFSVIHDNNGEVAIPARKRRSQRKANPESKYPTHEPRRYACSPRSTCPSHVSSLRRTSAMTSTWTTLPPAPFVTPNLSSGLVQIRRNADHRRSAAQSSNRKG